MPLYYVHPHDVDAVRLALDNNGSPGSQRLLRDPVPRFSTRFDAVSHPNPHRHPQSPSSPLGNYVEPETIYEAIHTYRPIAFRADALADQLGARVSTSATRSSAAAAASQARPRLSAPTSSHTSPSPGPSNDRTTRMSVELCTQIARDHPAGIRFEYDDGLLETIHSAVQDRLVNTKETGNNSNAGHLTRPLRPRRRHPTVPGPEADGDRDRDPEREHRIVISDEEKQRVGRWTTQYATAVETLTEEATLRYEIEQSNALRLFPAEAVNGVFRDAANWKPGQAPDPGLEWTMAPLAKRSGVADLLLARTGNPPHAALEYKRRSVVGPTHMDQIVDASSSLGYGQPRGFTLFVDVGVDAEQGGGGDDAGGVELFTSRGGSLLSNDLLDICLQIFAEMHGHGTSFNVLFNSCECLVFRLCAPDHVKVSRVVHRDRPDGMNIALILLGLGLLPVSQQRGSSTGQQDATRTLVPRMADLSVMPDSTGARGGGGGGDGDGGGGGGGDIVDGTSHRRTHEHRPSDKSLMISPPNSPSPTTLTLPHLPPTPPLSPTVPFLHQSAIDPNTRYDIKWCPSESHTLQVGKIIGAGRLWMVYEGTLSRATESDEGDDDEAALFSFDLDQRVWSAPPPSPSALPRAPGGRVHSGPISITTTITTTASSIPVAVKIFDPSVHIYGGADLAELDRSARTEVEMYAGPLAQARADGRPLAPACHAVWEWVSAAPNPDPAAVAAKGIIMIMDRVRPVFRGALSRGWTLSSLCDQDRESIVKLVDHLHRLGYAHGDIELRHIVQPDDGRESRMATTTTTTTTHRDWLLIDFDRAQHSIRAVERERRELWARLHAGA